MASTTPPPATGGGIGSTFTRRLGPLPVWVWMAGGLVLALIYRSWAANAAAGAQQTATTVDTTPPMVSQDYITINAPISTAPQEPPGQGRVEPPQVLPGNVKVPQQPTATGPRSATPGQWVTIGKWSAKNPVWNSTIAGIASHFKIKGGWQAVWNAPQNAALKARRKTPEHLQPGDKVYVPA